MYIKLTYITKVGDVVMRQNKTQKQIVTQIDRNPKNKDFFFFRKFYVFFLKLLLILPI